MWGGGGEEIKGYDGKEFPICSAPFVRHPPTLHDKQSLSLRPWDAFHLYVNNKRVLLSVAACIMYLLRNNIASELRVL